MVADRSLRWGVVGAGRISSALLEEEDATARGRIVALASRDSARGRRVLGETSEAALFSDYQELVESSEIDAVYVGVLHPSHAEVVKMAARAGKHVLCEKPMTVSEQDTRAVVEAAVGAGVVLLEAYQYKYQPQTLKLRELIVSGTIGRVLQVNVGCAFRAEFDPADRLFDRALGGGGILDVGCYPISYVQLIAAWSAGHAVSPSAFQGGGSRGVTGTDEWAVATLTYEHGMTALVRSGVRVEDAPELSIYGELGRIVVRSPWTPGKNGTGGVIEVYRNEEQGLEIVEVPTLPLFGAEMDAVESAVGDSHVGVDDNEQSIRIAEILDAWQGAF